MGETVNMNGTVNMNEQAISEIADELIELQTRIAYQEDTITQLNTVVTQQDATILQLQQQMRLLAKRIDELSFTQGDGSEEITHERPPHY
jgi:SlyX protein